MPGTEFLDKVFDQQGDVIPSLCKTWHGQCDYIEAMIKVMPKFPGLHHLSKVAI